LVEHHLAKVDVESSSLFACSIFKPAIFKIAGFLFSGDSSIRSFGDRRKKTRGLCAAGL
jgi:hypothetical protein